jgi:hypothetical protein
VRTIGLTPEVHEKVREALAAGAYQRDAATFAGVSVRTFYAWLARGREAAEALERGEPVESVDRDLAAFLHMVEGSRVRVAVDLLTVVQDAARRDWRAAAWFLERSYPEQWGKREPGKPGTSDPEIPVSALLKAGLTLTGPREKGDESRETDVPAPGTSGDVLTVRLEAAEALAAERLDRVRFLERELDRRSDELGALRLELTMLREVFSGPQALGTSRSSGWFRRSRTE